MFWQFLCCVIGYMKMMIIWEMMPVFVSTIPCDNYKKW